MTGANGAGSVAGSPLPKWQLALAVGAPVALGLGYMYYKNSTKPSPKPSRGKPKNTFKENGAPAADKQISIDVDCPTKPATTPETETPAGKAQKFKNAGNIKFKAGKFDEAIAQYNNAIETCPEENTEDLATFYQNRAAAYEQLKKYSAVKEDCTKALELKPRYAKALLRRARAMEHCNDLESALEDVTAACILESFANPTALEMADRVLKRLGKQHAMEFLANKKFIMPSNYVIKTYISTFQKDPVFTLLKNEDNSDISEGFSKALQALKEERYDDIIPLCTKELDSSDVETLPNRMEVLLLRGTFYLLLGKQGAALEDFETIVESDSTRTEVKVNALIKRSSLFTQLENPEKGFCNFAKAAELDPNCGDVFHHRGQVNLLMDRIVDAKRDFEKSVELNPKFEVGYVQKCYTDYRYAVAIRDMEMVADAIKNFEKAIEKFPNCQECYTLYAQMLSETQEYQKADDTYAKAIEKDPNNATVYVQRSILQLQWTSDIDKAVAYIHKALEVDNKCEFAYETLGAIEVQRGNLKEAINLFEKALALGRTAMELTHIFSLRDAAKAQLRVGERLGSDIVNLQNVS